MEAYHYVSDLMYLLPGDREPFASIQFNFPCYPCLMYSIADIRNMSIVVTIQDRLKALFANWPEARARPLVQDQEESQSET